MGLDSDPYELVALGMLCNLSDGANDTAPIQCLAPCLAVFLKTKQNASYTCQKRPTELGNGCIPMDGS